MKLTRLTGPAMAAFGLCLAAPALAQDDATAGMETIEPGAEYAPTVTREAGTEHLRTNIGVTLQGGGGVTNFFSSETRDATNVGGYWEVRTAIGTRSYAGLELAYVGNASDINAAGFESDAYLLGNGAEGNLRLQLPLVVGDGVLFEPFALAGLGWLNYNVINGPGSDNVMTVPLGAGLAIGYRGFIFDARWTYRATFDEDLFAVVDDNGANLQSWTLGASIGAEF